MSKGSIVQVIGTVVDVEFPPDKLPNIYNALETDLDGDKLVCFQTAFHKSCVHDW